MDIFDKIKAALEGAGFYVIDNLDDRILAAHGNKQAFITFSGVYRRNHYIKAECIVDVITTHIKGEKGVRDIVMEAVTVLHNADLVVLSSSRGGDSEKFATHSIVVRDP